MAARGGLKLTSIFILSVAILPLLASSAFFLPDLSGLFFPHNSDDNNSPAASDDENESGLGNGFLPGFGFGFRPRPNLFGWGRGSGQEQEGDVEDEGIREGFYNKSCPQAEKIVNEVLDKHFEEDPTIAPALVRMFFHDCFVKGCDASILLDVTPEGEAVEKNATHNGIFVRGYDVIDDIKTQLEVACPATVSCADILAFANRDSLVFTGSAAYAVSSGRRDGVSSLASNVPENLPLPSTPADEIIQMFENKNMTVKELTALIGAHSIGNAHCTVVAGRFHDPEKSQEMDPGYKIMMQSMTFCQAEDQDLPFDQSSSQKLDGRFYKQLLEKKSLLESDQNLTKEKKVNSYMRKFVKDDKGFMDAFTKAIIKLGTVEVLTGKQGEVRKNCRAVNL